MVGTVSIVLAAILALGALLLPPFSLSDRLMSLQFAPLNSDHPELAFADGLTIRLPQGAGPEDFAVRATAFSPADLASDRNSLPLTIAVAHQNLPQHLALKSALFQLEAIGSSPERLHFELDWSRRCLERRGDILVRLARTILALYPPSAAREGAYAGEADFLPDALALLETTADDPVIMITQELHHDLSPEMAQLATSTQSGRAATNRWRWALRQSGAWRRCQFLDTFSCRLSATTADPRVTDAATIERLISDPRVRGITCRANIGPGGLQRFPRPIHRLSRFESRAQR